MRYLNKIIFINSAHLPYAEIKLDGNIHFIGTQGVGKSTLLRAILFFYNVDKSKLGIKDRQLSYDDFYFPNLNSYIIYEVCRENGKFFVMSFKSSGRVAFRIIDCAYDKDFFIDQENNVRYDWNEINENIKSKVGKIYHSNIIRSYEDFRDIIYGNSQNVDRKLRRFSILESSKYQNVPRTIQNIFLNQSLESRVIKDTIINSMNFAKDSINLNTYREHLKEFQQKYEDIWKWFKVDKNGRNKVRLEADAVIDAYNKFVATKEQIKTLCANCNFAVERDEQRLPLIENDISKSKDDEARFKRLLSEEESKYNKERDALKRRESLVIDFLKRTKDKRSHYDEIGIDDILKRSSRKSEFEISRAALQKQIETLTAKNKSVKDKYEKIFSQIRSTIDRYNNDCNSRLNEIDAQKTALLEMALNELNRNTSYVRNECEEKIEVIQEELDNLNQEKSELKVAEQRISQTNPYQDDVSQLNKLLREEEANLNKLSLNIKTKGAEIERIINEVESQEKDLKNKCLLDEANLQNQIQNLNTQIEALDDLLRKQDGSLIEWLSGNVDSWENSIGKVLDEEVLYDTSLSPRLVSPSNNNLYGVHIDLENIEKEIATPEKLKNQKQDLQHKIEALQQQIVSLRVKLEQEIEKLKRSLGNKVKNLRKEIMSMQSQQGQSKFNIEKYSKEIHEYDLKLAKWRKEQVAKIREELGQIEMDFSDADAQLVGVKLQRENNLIKYQKSYNKEKDRLNKFAVAAKKQAKAFFDKRKSEEEGKITFFKGKLDAELKGSGVNMDELNSIRASLKEVEDELNFISEHSKDVYSWERDKEEYFDLEQSKREERKLVAEKLSNLERKFQERKEKKLANLADTQEVIRKLNDELEKLTEVLSRVKDFRHNSTAPIELSKNLKKETNETLFKIFDDLLIANASKQQGMEDFKHAVNVFKSNFSQQNTFDFRTDLDSDSDYIDFASNLNDFQLNNKIEIYRTRTNEMYSQIISRIANEVADLSKYSAEIRMTINEINKDFRDNNFAGVIKNIELRAVESNDRLMQQLLNIKKFDDEYGFNLGQLNLFSAGQDQEAANDRAVKLLMAFVDMLGLEQKRDFVTLSDTFKLEFKVRENDNDTNWVEKLKNVGSDGTDVLVKAMVNIMLINVFKKKISRKFGDFKLHCMMDEIGKLHPDNVEGILKFANVRNIFLINSSPTTYNAQIYKYTYSLSKDSSSNTVVKTLLSIN